MGGKRGRFTGRKSPALVFTDRRGATALEFAMLALPFTALLLACLQTAIIFFASQALQSVAATAARQILVGNVQTNNLTSSSFLNTVVCPAAPSLFACPKLMVDVQSAASFSNLNTAPIAVAYNAKGQPTNLSFSPGSQGSAVIMRVMYEWPVIGGPLGIGLANEGNGNHLMVGTVVLKTEPY